MTFSSNTLNFSTYFGVDHEAVEAYGALDISLVNDLPLFIDPFLLFSSDKPEYQEIHREIVRYLLFLKDKARGGGELGNGMYDAWFAFSEVRQNWLGFSRSGNKGRGMGRYFAEGLFKGFQTVFADFGEEEMLESPHMEKLCLVSPNTGKDKISDFTANFAKRYLLEYTQRFAMASVDSSKTSMFRVGRVRFDYKRGVWLPGTYTLPVFEGDFVLLTPRDMLTRDDTFLNHTDMVHSFEAFAPSIGDAALRFQLERFIREVLGSEEMRKKGARDKAVSDFIQRNPGVVNFYMQYKEGRKAEARKFSAAEVDSVDGFFVDAAASISSMLCGTPFYSKFPTSYGEALERVRYLKHVIEDCDGYRLLWDDAGRPAKESSVQLLFKFVWLGTERDVNREPNNGRGPVDYSVSLGAADKALVEFKLASNPKLRQNLENQVEIYKRANKTGAAITVVVYYRESELKKVKEVLNDLGVAGSESIVLIDARKDDKTSASNVR